MTPPTQKHLLVVDAFPSQCRGRSSFGYCGNDTIELQICQCLVFGLRHSDNQQQLHDLGTTPPWNPSPLGCCRSMVSHELRPEKRKQDQLFLDSR